MTTPAHDIGDQRRLSVEIRDHDGDLGDPTDLTLVIREPDGVLTTKVQNEMARPSLGIYSHDFTITKPGRHIYNFKAAAGIITAGEGEFYAKRKGAQ